MRLPAFFRITILLLSLLSCKSKKNKVAAVTDPQLTPELVASFNPADKLMDVSWQVNITGTPLTLNYRSDRAPGAVVSRVIPLRLTQPGYHPSLETVKIEIEAGDQKISKSFPDTPNLFYNYIWDVKDKNGNRVPAPATAKFRLGYVYKGQDTAKWTERTIHLNDWNSIAFGLGGWSLSIHHAFRDHVVYLGDGQTLFDMGKPISVPAAQKGEIVIPSKKGSEIFIFDSSGRHQRTLNAFTGKAIHTFKYNEDGHLISIDDAFGNSTRIERNKKEIPVAIIAPYGQRTELTQNDDGWLSVIKTPAGTESNFQYTRSGMLVDVKQSGETTAHFEYDGLGRIIKRSDLSATPAVIDRKVKTDETNYSIGPAGQYTVKVPSDAESHHIYTDSMGSKMEVVMNHQLDKKTIRYPNGVSVEVQDDSDPRWKMRSPFTGSVTVLTPSGKKSEITTGKKVSLAQSSDPLSLKTSNETVTINGNKYSRIYTKEKNEIALVTPTGKQHVGNLDEHGRLVKMQSGDMYPWTYTYDEKGRLKSLSQGSGTDSRSIGINYAADGMLSSLAGPANFNTRFEYDKGGRIIKKILPDGSEIALDYDETGRPSILTSATGSKYTFKYGPQNNNIVQLTAPGDKPANYTYDAQNRMTKMERADGDIVIEYERGNAARKISYPGGHVSVVRDPKTGSVSSISTSDGNNINYAYDGFLQTGATWTGVVQGSVTRSFNNNFRVDSITVSGQTIQHQYDPDGSIIQAGELMLNYDVKNGLLIGTKLGNVSTVRANNGFGEIDRFNANYDSVSLLDVQYIRDKLGRIISKTETIGGQTATYKYNYDQAGRLIEVLKDAARAAQYQYDKNGNRIGYAAGNENTSSKFDSQDRLTRSGQSSFKYAGNGELLSKTADGKTTNYTYDGVSNLRALTTDDGTKIEYILDGTGRRIGKKVNGTLVQGFIYQDKLQPAAELDAQNNIVSRFVYATRNNVPEYMIKGGVIYRFINDHLGSPRLIVDVATGNIIQRIDYDAFGNVIADSNPGFQPFGFAGGLYDQHSKLTRFGARDYDAAPGRWTTKDPLSFAGGDMNLYAYVTNDPVNRSDHFGMSEDDDDSWFWWATGGGIGVIASTGGVIKGAGVMSPPVVYTMSSATWTVAAAPAPASAIFGGGGVGLAGAGTAISGVAAAAALGLAYGYALDQLYNWAMGESLGESIADWNFTFGYTDETLADWWYHAWNGYGNGDPNDSLPEYWNNFWNGAGGWWNWAWSYPSDWWGTAWDYWSDWWYGSRNANGCEPGFEYNVETGECFCDNWSDYWATLCPPGVLCAGLPCKSIVGIPR